VPDFRLQDAQGKVWTLDSIMGPKGAMLVFSRSVDWCPYCKTQVIELQSRLGELKAQGLGLAVITYDSPAVMADFSRRRGITFPSCPIPALRRSKPTASSTPRWPRARATMASPFRAHS
jgi:peroxiredoxin